MASRVSPGNGPGMMSSYKKRIKINPDDVAAMTLVKLGCGNSTPGYYMYQGGTNPDGTYVDAKEHDIGHMFHTWFRALGINPKEKEYNNAGQPLPIAHEECSAIDDVLA